LENTPFLCADQGGEKPYRLLANAIAKSGRVAIAELVSRSKEQLVLIRPYCKGLVRHTPLTSISKLLTIAFSLKPSYRCSLPLFNHQA
jgi:hypothetical protein